MKVSNIKILSFFKDKERKHKISQFVEENFSGDQNTWARVNHRGDLAEPPASQQLVG